MKNLKEHKVQILAAIALAFSLGMVVPTVFVNDGVYAATQSEAQNVPVAQLLKVINEAAVTNSAKYKKYEDLVNAYDALNVASPAEDAISKAVAAVTALNSETELTTKSSKAEVLAEIAGMPTFVTWAPAVRAINKIIEDTTATQPSDINAATLANYTPAEIDSLYNAINDAVNPKVNSYDGSIVVLAGRIANDSGFDAYRTHEELVAAALKLEANKEDTAAKTALATAASTVLKLTGASDLSADSLLIEVKARLADYDKYVALYNALGFVREALPEGGDDVDEITKDDLTKKYSANELVNYYGVLAVAAQAIDPFSVNNLAPFEMPDTSVGTPEEKPSTDNNDKVNTPNTGIVGLFEAGALDLGTITLIASVAVASVAGLGLIAKLYLKRKF